MLEKIDAIVSENSPQSDCYTRLKCDKDKVMKENVNQNSFKELMGATLQFHKIRFFGQKKNSYISVFCFSKKLRKIVISLHSRDRILLCYAK